MEGVDAFLELKTGADKVLIPGETSDAEFSAQAHQAIELRDFRFGFAEDHGGPSEGTESENAPKRSKFFFEVTKLVDSASPRIFALYCEGLEKATKKNASAATSLSCADQVQKDPSSVIKATVSLRKSGGKPFVFTILTFSCVSVSTYDLNWDGEYITETVKCNAKKCVIEYRAQDATGAVDQRTSSTRDVKGWDFSETKT